MQRGVLALCLLPLLCTGCATLHFSKDTVQAVMCSQVNKDYTPKAGYITDTFDLTGKIYMACTFNFVNGKTYINKFIPLKWKWYMGDVLKSQDSAKKTFTWAPAPMWFSIPPLALGIGKGHVELYEGDTLLVTKNFEIVEKLPDTTPAESASK